MGQGTQLRMGGVNHPCRYRARGFHAGAV